MYRRANFLYLSFRAPASRSFNLRLSWHTCLSDVAALRGAHHICRCAKAQRNAPGIALEPVCLEPRKAFLLEMLRSREREREREREM